MDAQPSRYRTPEQRGWNEAIRINAAVTLLVAGFSRSQRTRAAGLEPHRQLLVRQLPRPDAPMLAVQQATPLLQEVDAQHARNRTWRPAGPHLRVVRLDQVYQRAHDLLRVVEELPPSLAIDIQV